MRRSVRYSSSPLLASKTPVWRSKFIVACLAPVSYTHLTLPTSDLV